MICAYATVPITSKLFHVEHRFSGRDFGGDRVEQRPLVAGRA
jgi:hypothetical protein